MSTPENPNAFPACNEANVNGTMGMTLRDYFAGQAMTLNFGPKLTGQEVARQAYLMAETMLAERKNGGAA